MMVNVLITGVSGYLGGSLLHLLSREEGPFTQGNIYALVRSSEQATRAEAAYRCTAAVLDLADEAKITAFLLEKQITVVFHLIDAVHSHVQLLFIRALGVLSKQLGVNTHFLHTSGAKIFSGFADHPTDRAISDAGDELSRLQATAQPQLAGMRSATQTNTAILEACKASGVRCYIFIPCIVYGQGTGFGNKISIQTVAVVRAAKAVRRVRKVDRLDGPWPVCHIHDNSTLYAHILRKILAGEDVPHNEQGYYLASSGAVAWKDIYSAFAKALARRGVVDTEEVGDVTEESIAETAQALNCPEELVPLAMGGKCTLRAEHGTEIGWKPWYSPQDLLENANDEVDLILRNLE